MKKKIIIVGNGQFGKFIKIHLEKYFEVEIFDREIMVNLALKNISADFSLEKIETDFIILAVPLPSLEEVCKTFENKISTKTIIVDVTSVKVKPLQIIEKYFPNNKFKILGTHPIFGPQSGKNGIENLPMVLTNVSLSEEEYLQIKNFLGKIYKLKIIEKTASKHDEEMVYIQGLSHFIGRALKALNIQEYETATSSYKQLISLKNLVGSDSFELYKTIQNGNPATKNIRKKFLEQLLKLEKDLENEN
jgi:prephenate dehydrogenase